MRTLIVYDSTYGNTEKIAKAVAGAIPGEVKAVRVGEAQVSNLKPADLLIVGSPTHGGRPTPAVQGFLDGIPEFFLKDIRVAAFDTRLSGRLVGVFGYAAPRIAGSLQARGGTLILPPEGFFVKRKDGPLGERELERAAEWAKGIAR